MSAPRVRDDALVARLRRIAAAVDPVPEAVHEAARAVLSTRDLDRRLAELIADSTDPDDNEDSYEKVRTWTGDGPANSRLLSFAGGDVQVDLEVSAHGERLVVIGQFTGASTEDCALEYANGERLALDVDGLGRFLVNGLRPGPVRARCRAVDGAAVVTAWVTL
jgi:hypothetical protein